MWLDSHRLGDGMRQEEVAPGCCPLVVPYPCSLQFSSDAQIDSCLTSSILRPRPPCTVVAIRQVFLELSCLDCMHSGQFEVWTI